jgi:DNA-binding CsgD family transcriptional regulator
MNVQSMSVTSFPVRHSPVLGRILSAVAPRVLALLDCQHQPRLLAGFDLPAPVAGSALPPALRGLAQVLDPQDRYPKDRHPEIPHSEGRTRSRIARAEVVPLPAAALPRAELDRLLPAGRDEGGWHGFRCRLDCGTTDLVLVHLPATRFHARAVAALLRLIWPALRSETEEEAWPCGAEDHCDEALLWLMRARIDIGALVVNPRGLILRMNSTARRMIADGRVLARGHRGLHASCPDQTRKLREAITLCANEPMGEDERILFLRPADDGPAVPVTLARYVHEGAPTELVTLLLPEPPESARVERIARELGLTAAEARVAAMLQTGLSNRAAATSLGLTEQSFSTYAKRVLAKLNVRSRAEMAQMLTWQTHGGTEP